MRIASDLRTRLTWMLLAGCVILVPRLDGTSGDQLAPIGKGASGPNADPAARLEADHREFSRLSVNDQMARLRELKETPLRAIAALPWLCEFLAESDGSRDDAVIAAALDVIRSLGRRAAPIADRLAKLLVHRCRLYKGRDKMQVVRLRSYLFVTLADIGFPPTAVPFLLDSVAHVEERTAAVEAASAARATGSLGPGGRQLAPYLLRTLSEPFSEEEMSLDRYQLDFPQNEATTAQLEAIRALGRVAAMEDRQVIESLTALAERPSSDRMDPRVGPEARKALAQIRKSAGR